MLIKEKKKHEKHLPPGICFLAVLLLFANCAEHSHKNKGYPDKQAGLDVLPGFVNPPKGYGNIPFYWWNGDTLNKERLSEQLDILSSSATDGFAVSYVHTDPAVDTLYNKDGYGLFGRTEPGKPEVFSDEWWEIWNWFSGECKRRGLGAGLDDYTVGWIGNGYYPDELDSMSVFSGYKGELQIDTIPVKAGSTFTYSVPENILSVMAWPGKTELTACISNGQVEWEAPAGNDYRVYVITTKPGYVIHPEHGKRLVDVYFNRFEKKMDADGKKGMNYFFQDELSYPINRFSWSDDFREEFLKRKGYDIIPYLPALKEPIGEITPKIRLDYLEVLMDLSEERYYKPIYNWHAERGLIYGCDNLSRGKNPIAYIDYFRAMSWFTAPGNDAPSAGSSFLETKVSSSIAHLYNRPRTWLEAFHSMGWESSAAWLTKQIDHHFMAGGNLVCMHGLYYSTHGGWWEWAPPDFHFRMPYWPHMKQWLKYTERMSYLLSQGSHVCDIALLYPTEPMQAYPEAKPDSAFNLALRLSNSGLDYDFADYRSLREAHINENYLSMSDEKYQVIILADMKAIHHASFVKILDFYRSGGIVLATGDLPYASNEEGEGGAGVEKITREIFGVSYTDIQKGIKATKHTNHLNGVGWYLADGSIEKVIPELITPDFIPENHSGKVLHRKAGFRDVYMVTDVEKGARCFFRSKGKVELWNAVNGEIHPYPVVEQTDEGTVLHIYKEADNASLIVFSPGEPVMEKESGKQAAPVDSLALDGEWEVELLPTLQNKWGDYRFPAFDGYIGAEARSFRYTPDISADGNWMLPHFNDSNWQEEIYGYGPQAESRLAGKTDWAPLSFSWQYGVWDNPGAQGYHGLKGKVSDGFFILDKGSHQQYRTFVYADKEGLYRMETDGRTPSYIKIDNQEADIHKTIRLAKGWHSVLAGYKETKKTKHRSQTGSIHDNRERSAIVFYPSGYIIPEKLSPYSEKISSRWGNSEHLLFDPYGGKYDKWYFRFKSAPGMEKMIFTIYGNELEIWFDGIEIPQQYICQIDANANWNRFEVSLQETKKQTGIVAFGIKARQGYQGTSILKEPVGLITGKGLLKPGNWAETGALLHYSGGMYYRKTISLAEITGKKAELDLGDVIATCEVKINNKLAGILMSPPFQMDITPYISAGKNHIEVLVYNTLSNHYQAIPTPYRGDPKAGLLGPVNIFIYNQSNK
ncbi:MAG: hypothetical protein LBL79_14055 [Prevotella sp.]|jgi:hypothetical protein|nr:hypothetical protein [Prevotella sp.]